jgi:hypothetical protein
MSNRRHWQRLRILQAKTTKAPAVTDLCVYHSTRGEQIHPVFAGLSTDDAHVISWRLLVPKSDRTLRNAGMFQTIEKAKRAARERTR